MATTKPTTQARRSASKSATKADHKPSSLRDALSAEKPRTEEVKLDCWPEPVVMKAPSLSDRMLIGKAYQDLKDNQQAAADRANAIGICAAMHDQNGERVFDPANEADVDTVSRLAPHVLGPLVAALYRINGYVTVGAAEKN